MKVLQFLFTNKRLKSKKELMRNYAIIENDEMRVIK